MSEAKLIFIPYDSNILTVRDHIFVKSIGDVRTEFKVREVKEAVSEGWRIASTVPLIGSYGSLSGPTFQYTIGYEVWLQRD